MQALPETRILMDTNKKESTNSAAQLRQYDFSRPIRLTAMRSGGLDTLFYSFMLSICLTAMILILSLRGGKLHIEFTFWRTLACLPFSVIAVIFWQLLSELRKYPPRLAKQNVWTIDELMALTGKDRDETERIITRILESCFEVDPSCILGSEENIREPEAPQTAAEEPAAEEKDSFSRYDS